MNQPDVNQHPEAELDIGQPTKDVDGPWLVIVDPQVIFADPESQWGAPDFGQALANIRRLAPHFDDRIVVTRWMPTADRDTSWGPYFDTFPFADKPADDELFQLVPEIGEMLLRRPTVDLPTFGKWGSDLAGVLGSAVGPNGMVTKPVEIIVTGVSTDCCVVATALGAADGGAQVDLVRDACADSSPEKGQTAVDLMKMFRPQIRMTNTDEALERLT